MAMGHDYYPGNEFALANGQGFFTEYLYEIDRVHPVHTTSGQILFIPDIEYRGRVEIPGEEPIDSAATRVPYRFLTESQRQALSTAQQLRSMRERQSPALNTFSYLRRLVIHGDLLCITAAEEGSSLKEERIVAPVRTATCLGSIDFATEIYGNPGLLRYDEADIIEFTPPELRDRANGYVLMDTGRIVVGDNDEINESYQLSRFMLYDAEADMSYRQPVGE